MTDIPRAETLTTAPLRHRLSVEFDGQVREVWALVGDHRRLPEYSEGIERVDLAPGREARICHFRRPEGATQGVVLRERIRWEKPAVGYSTSADVPNDFGLINDLSIVTVAPASEGTRFTWEQYYDHPDLPAMLASFDEGIVDIGQRLVARFGGRVVERCLDRP